MNLLLVEDDAVFAEMLAAALGTLGHRIVQALDGRAALEAMDRDQFDAVILDRMLPRLDGMTVLERLRSTGRKLPVLMLTALGQSVEKIEGLQAGADDYVVKPIPAAEIDARLRALIRAREWNLGDGDTLRAGNIVISPTRHRAWRASAPLDLSKLELALLSELVRNADAVLTRAMLLERVWGYDFQPTTNIVDVQVRALRLKLATGDGEDPIVTVRGVGYMVRA